MGTVVSLIKRITVSLTAFTILSLFVLAITASAYTPAPYKPLKVELEDGDKVFYLTPPNVSHSGYLPSGLYYNTDPPEAIYLIDDKYTRNLSHGDEVFLSSDGMYFARFTPIAEGGAYDTVLEFYANGVLISDYAVSDLVSDTERLVTKEYDLIAGAPSTVEWQTGGGQFSSENNTLTVKTIDGISYTFDIVTGEIVDEAAGLPDSSTATIAMKENHSIGYTWEHTIKPGGIVRHVSQRYVSDNYLDESGVPLVGVGQTCVHTFEAVAEGEAEIVFTLYFRGAPDESGDTIVYKAIVDSLGNLTIFDAHGNPVNDYVLEDPSISKDVTTPSSNVRETPSIGKDITTTSSNLLFVVILIVLAAVTVVGVIVFVTKKHKVEHNSSPLPFPESEYDTEPTNEYSTVETPTTKICPNCLYETGGDTVYCPRCGTKCELLNTTTISDVSAANQEEPATGSWALNIFGVLGYILAFIVSIAGGVYYIFGAILIVAGAIALFAAKKPGNLKLAIGSWFCGAFGYIVAIFLTNLADIYAIFGVTIIIVGVIFGFASKRATGYVAAVTSILVMIFLIFRDYIIDFLFVIAFAILNALLWVFDVVLS